LVITLPAPITALSPMLIGAISAVFDPIKTFSPITVLNLL
jgi:hypothetical protein